MNKKKIAWMVAVAILLVLLLSLLTFFKISAKKDISGSEGDFSTDANTQQERPENAEDSNELPAISDQDNVADTQNPVNSGDEQENSTSTTLNTEKPGWESETKPDNRPEVKPTWVPVPTKTPGNKPTAVPTQWPVPTSTPGAMPTPTGVPVPTRTPGNKPTTVPTQRPVPTATPGATTEPIPTQTPEHVEHGKIPNDNGVELPVIPLV